ncbi:Rid family hydrolase [Glycomyces buryatensis]|uniref:RidA family protein n=1 Tax=Glycomyces buryatensis TaxID=2570927 RepID=A0A4V4HRX2_9ACTN|nr:Rid family hydrolase [Glycomyces buryatensis]THV39536.1 RidA family protein [Glycomyces buryatensis]
MSLVKRVPETGHWAQLYGYSRAVAVGPLVVTSACTADLDANPDLAGDPRGQAKAAFRTALDAMVHAGAGVSDVVRSRLYVTDPSYADPVGRVHGEFFGVVKPTATVVTVSQLFHPGQLVAVELEGFRAWRDID